MSLYVEENQMFQALISKLEELKTSGVFEDVIIGFEEDFPTSYPVLYVEIMDERFEPATANKDQYVMEINVVIEYFDSDYQEGQSKVRELAMRVYEALVNDRRLSDNVDQCNVESLDTEVEAHPDGFLFHKNMTVTLTKWWFG